jgi:hypothetical protein
MKHTDYYVYIYCDPRKPGIFTYDGLDFIFNYEPFYVGCGRGYRWRRHVTNFEIEWNYNTIKNGKIKNIIQNGFDLIKFVVFYKTNLDRQTVLLIEIELISKIKRYNLGGPLTNLTEGGEYHIAGISSKNKGKTYEEIYGFEKASELKEKRRKYLIGNDYGKKSKGRKMSEQQKKILSESKSKKLKQLDFEFNVIKIWKSAKEAAETLGISLGSIHNVLGNTRNKSAGGFYWEYIEKENIKYKKLKNN